MPTTVSVTNNSMSVNPMASLPIVIALPSLSKNTQQCGLYRDRKRPGNKLDALCLNLDKKNAARRLRFVNQCVLSV
jgi:hypothetical protein